LAAPPVAKTCRRQPMPFRRTVAPTEAPEPSALAADLAAIGLKPSAAASRRQPNIEDTLLFASIEAMDRDSRLLAPLVLWFRVHHPWVNADRLIRVVREQDSSRPRAFWAAIAKQHATDHRFARLASGYRGPRVVLGDGGREDPRFKQGPLTVSAELMRAPADVLEPIVMARRHNAYRWRVIMGPSYRADMWAALEADPELTPAELARRTYGSFATAWHVKRDYALLGGRSLWPKP